MRIILNIVRARRRALAPFMRTAVVGVLAFGVLAGCASRLPEPGAADAMRAARLWPGTTVSDLHRGKQRYVQACASCHGLVDPHRFPSERWPLFVKEMSGKLQLTPGDVDDLTRYLVVASQSPPAP